MNLFIIDYSCHPFSLDLANQFAKKKIQIKYFFSKNVNLTGNYYFFFKKKFSIYPIDTGQIPKHNFIKRRFKEIEFAKKIIDHLKKNKPNKVLLANLPIDALYLIIKFCKKNKIQTYFWMQDIYYLAIKNFFKKNKFLYFFIGFFISKIYEYYEKFCYLNSSKNILITSNFLNFFPKKKNNFFINIFIFLD